MGVRDFLENSLMYEEHELEDLTILGMKMAAKGDNVIYLALRGVKDVKEMFARKAELKDDKIIVRNFIPPQFFCQVHGS